MYYKCTTAFNCTSFKNSFQVIFEIGQIIDSTDYESLAAEEKQNFTPDTTNDDSLLSDMPANECDDTFNDEQVEDTDVDFGGGNFGGGGAEGSW